MSETSEMTLPSGAKLEVTLSPFKIARELERAVAEELREMHLDPKAELDANFFKDVFCAGVASRRIDLALVECMKRCTYNGLKITDETWEPEQARQDYHPACFEVLSKNIQPFMKSLYAQYQDIIRKMQNILA